MRYRNTKTGAIIDSPCNISGGDWQLETVVTEEEVEVEPIPDKRLDKHTKSELYEMLESQGIAYKPEQTKKELIELLEGD